MFDLDSMKSLNDVQLKTLPIENSVRELTAKMIAVPETIAAGLSNGYVGNGYVPICHKKMKVPLPPMINKVFK